MLGPGECPVPYHVICVWAGWTPRGKLGTALKTVGLAAGQPGEVGILPGSGLRGQGTVPRGGVMATSTSESLRLGPWLPLSPQTNPSWFIPTASRTQADSEGPEPSGHAGASWRKGLCNPALRDGVWGLGQRLF